MQEEESGSPPQLLDQQRWEGQPAQYQVESVQVDGPAIHSAMGLEKTTADWLVSSYEFDPTHKVGEATTQDLAVALAARQMDYTSMPIVLVQQSVVADAATADGLVAVAPGDVGVEDMPNSIVLVMRSAVVVVAAAAVAARGPTSSEAQPKQHQRPPMSRST